MYKRQVLFAFDAKDSPQALFEFEARREVQPLFSFEARIAIELTLFEFDAKGEPQELFVFLAGVVSGGECAVATNLLLEYSNGVLSARWSWPTDPQRTGCEWEIKYGTDMVYRGQQSADLSSISHTATLASGTTAQLTVRPLCGVSRAKGTAAQLSLIHI